MTFKPLIELLKEVLAKQESEQTESELVKDCLQRIKSGDLEGLVQLLCKNTPEPEPTPYEIGKAWRLAEKGLETLDANNLEEAGSLLQRAFKLEPDSAYGCLGRYCEKKGYIQGARAAFEKMVELMPRDSNIATLAWFYSCYDTPEKAEALLIQTLQEHTDNTICLDTLVNLYDKLGRIQDAKKFIDKTLEDRPDQWHAHAVLGHFFWNQNKYEDAVAAFQKSVELFPHAAGYNSLALCYKELGRLEETEEALKKQIEAEPDSHFHHFDLGKFYRDQKRYKEAMPVLKRAAELAPDVCYVHSAISDCYVGLGRVEEALEYLKKVIEAAKEEVDSYIYRDLGDCYSRLNRFDEARAAYLTAEKKGDIYVKDKLAGLDAKQNARTK